MSDLKIEVGKTYESKDGHEFKILFKDEFTHSPTVRFLGVARTARDLYSNWFDAQGKCEDGELTLIEEAIQ